MIKNTGNYRSQHPFFLHTFQKRTDGGVVSGKNPQKKKKSKNRMVVLTNTCFLPIKSDFVYLRIFRIQNALLAWTITLPKAANGIKQKRRNETSS